MDQWFNKTLPLQNTTAMKNIAVLAVGPTATGVDLRTLFASPTKGVPTAAAQLCTPSGGPNIDAGHFYTIRADVATPLSPGAAVDVLFRQAWRAYLALGPSIRAIDETAVGNATGACWPLVDGQEIRGKIPVGKEVAQGVATAPVYSVLNFKAAPGGGTGYLRIYRSSLAPNQDTSEFQDPYVKF